MADRRHAGLAVAGGRTGGHPHRARGGIVPAGGWTDRRTPSWPAADRRSYGRFPAPPRARNRIGICRSCWPWRSTRTSPSRRPDRRAMPWTTIRFAAFISICAQVYDAFGPRRMFWGTDITRMPCSWRQCVTLFTEELPWLTGDDLDLVMGRAFCDWIGWTVAGGVTAQRRRQERCGRYPVDE